MKLVYAIIAIATIEIAIIAYTEISLSILPSSYAKYLVMVGVPLIIFAIDIYLVISLLSKKD
jgi:hypothetical protein